LGVDTREKQARVELDYMLMAEHQLPIFVDELHPSTQRYTDAETLTSTPSLSLSSPKPRGTHSLFSLRPWLGNVRGLPKERYHESFYRAAERRYSKQGMTILRIWP
jgi:hypothetical protein